MIFSGGGGFSPFTKHKLQRVNFIFSFQKNFLIAKKGKIPHTDKKKTKFNPSHLKPIGWPAIEQHAENSFEVKKIASFRYEDVR